MIANISHCERPTNGETDNHLDILASSALSLDPYSGCAHPILYACHNIARLVGRVETQGAISYADFAEEAMNMYA